MAITRLTDFVTVATSKWTYGDSAFKYEGEVNQDHDTIYPLMIMTPPSSRMPDIYEGFEHYNVEMEFYNTYQTAAQNAVTLQQRWDNLQDLALEWLDNVLINYSGGVIPNVSTSSPTPTQVYIDKESLRLERINNNKNDKLCRITMTFDMRMFTRCFTPKSVYPDTISNFALWLRADSGVTYDIPNKRVTNWLDQSGYPYENSEQTTIGRQPLRIGYDGPSDKTQITFDNQYIISENDAPFYSENLSLFIVAKASSLGVNQTLFNIGGGGNSQFSARITSGNQIQARIEAATGEIVSTLVGIASATDWNIYYFEVDGGTPNYTVKVKVNQSGGLVSSSGAFPTGTDFDNDKYVIAADKNVGSLPTEFFGGGISEVIGYSKKLSTDERNQVTNYLNNKYKIY